MIEVQMLRALSDNYIYVLRDSESGQVAAVDPSEAKPVLDFLNARQWPLHMILNTHHHHDHVGGNLELQKIFNCEVYGSKFDKDRIPGVTHQLADGDTIVFGGDLLTVMSVPGHTLGAIAYYSRKSQLLFTGDTLFTYGCGRLFEGTADQLHESLLKLASLPDDTLVYSGHEYGYQNLAFARHTYPKDPEVLAAWKRAKTLLREKKPLMPSSLGLEKKINPFLTARNSSEFAQLRREKDHFRLEDPDALR